MRYLILITIYVCIGCATISGYDDYSYKQVTSLKIDALTIIGKATDSYFMHQTEVDEFNNKMLKQMEYEKFSRHKNETVVKMYNVIYAMLNDTSSIKFFGKNLTLWSLINDTAAKNLLHRDWEIASDTSILIKGYSRGLFAAWKRTGKLSPVFVDISKGQISEAFSIVAELESHKIKPDDDKVYNFINQ